MAIVRMKKITVAAPNSERDEVLRSLQNLGNVHLIDLGQNVDELEGVETFNEVMTLSETEAEYNQIKFTLEFLSGFTKEKKGMFTKREEMSPETFESLKESVKWKDTYFRSKNIEERLGVIKNHKGKLNASLEQYRQWIGLDVSSRELNMLRTVSYTIGTVSQRYEGEFYEELSSNHDDIHIEKISEKQQDSGFFILYPAGISDEVSEIFKKYGFTKVGLDLEVTPAEKIGMINSETLELDKEQKLLLEEASLLSGELAGIELVYDYMLSKLEKDRAISSLVRTSRNFILQGWVPAEDENRIRAEIEGKFKDSFVEFEEPGEEEEPPTALKNGVLAEPFELVTSMYSLPNKNEVDPTPILTIPFLVFFGMMMSDIGYGAAMFVAGFVMLRFMDIQGAARKIAKITLYTSIPTMIFGALYGSFFTAGIRPLWINPLDNPMLVLGVSVALGVLHLVLALGVKAYQQIRSGGFVDALFDVGSLYAIIFGLIWYVAGTQGILPAGQLGSYLAIVGVIGVFIASGRSSEGIGGKIGSGLFGVYGLTGYVGDALSYSRLMALGLATGLIGSAFNIMTDLLGDNLLLKYTVGTVILLIGHTFNLLINALGSYVHTSRLQYVEFFGKFYEGGGKPYEPLEIKTKHVKVKTDK